MNEASHLNENEPIINIDEFSKNGFQIFRQLLSRSVINEIKLFLDTELETAYRCLAQIGIVGKVEELVAKIAEFRSSKQFASLDTETRMMLAGQFPLSTRWSEKLWAIPKEQGLQSILRSILGETRLYMHMPPVARFVLPNNGLACVPPHQDISYNKHMSNFVSVWAPLVEIDDLCGGVTIYKGSATKGEILMSHERNVWLPAIETKNFEKVNCIPMSPGDVLIFNQWIVHESMPNTSDCIRISLDLRFFSSSNTSSKLSLDMDNWQVIKPIPASQFSVKQ